MGRFADGLEVAERGGERLKETEETRGDATLEAGLDREAGIEDKVDCFV